MKANQKHRDIKKNPNAFSFLVPFTMSIVVSVALLVVGAYVVGEITDTLEGTFPSATGDRSDNQNRTINVLGNITDGFADVVDIEIVVMIIVGLSMAIFAIIGIGTRRTI